MVDDLVHEIAVVADDDDAAVEILEVLLENLQGIDVEVVGRFVEDEEVGALHQHGAEIEPALLASRELVDVVLLLQGREHEVLEELHGRQTSAASEVDVFGYLADGVDDLHLLVELHAVLTVVAEADGLADDEAAAVGLHQAEQHLDERALPRSVSPDDAKLLVAREVVVEVLEDDAVSEAFADVFRLEDFAADVGGLRLQLHLLLFQMAVGAFLQVVESLLAVAGLMAASLGHAPHPLELCAVEVRGPRHLSPRHLEPLGTLLEIVGIVAVIGIDGLVVHLEDDGTDAVQEVTVVRHHQQRHAGTGEVVLEPLYHLQVEVVRRFVEDEHVGLHDEGVGQRHALELSARKLGQRLVELGDEELREDGLGACLVVPRLEHLHAVENRLQSLLAPRGHACLVFAYEVRRLVPMPEASLDDGEVEGIAGRLLQVADPQAVAVDDLPLVGLVGAAQDVEQGAFARSVLGNKAHLLPFAYAEAEVREEGPVPYPSR